MIHLSSIRDHFPVRRTEWVCAGIITLLGLRLLDPAETFAQPAFRELAERASEGTWGSVLFWFGVCRLLVLAYNGAFRPSPELRGIAAVLGGLIFLALCIGIEASGVASTGTVVYGFLVLTEISNIWTAGGDARVPYRDRVAHHGKLSS